MTDLVEVVVEDVMQVEFYQKLSYIGFAFAMGVGVSFAFIGYTIGLLKNLFNKIF